ncbi:MAG: Uncharacterised protein [Flavobacterium sp. SCGC AAA160-P02]|nr:MAG: Uncharacterised protein [Flavobacterium sp. SCGC AAA160-P02]
MSKKSTVIFSCVIIGSYIIGNYFDIKLAPVIATLIFTVIYFSIRGNS